MDMIGNDFAGAGASLTLLTVYHVFLRLKLRANPLYTI